MIVALVAQGIMGLAALLFSLIGAGNLEGWGRFPIALQTSIPGWAVTAIIIESILWMFATGTQGFLIWKMYQFFTVGVGYQQMKNPSVDDMKSDIKDKITTTVIKNLT